MDVALRVDRNGVPLLLTNDRLTFGALVDTQTGAVLNPIRRAIDRGLTFRLVPRRSGQGDRVEMKGSLHKFCNNGEHNADQFTANDLLLTLDQLVMEYGIDPFSTKINAIEFGVNVVLPFPAAQVLQNLVSYKNKSFYRDARSQTPYHECRFQQFTVKIYDKGKQRGLGDYLLRVEIKVVKMAYFNKTSVRINTLADLIDVTNYVLLGKLLVDAFSNILFDDPKIDPAVLTPGERDIYQNGRNPRYWYIPKGLTPKRASTHRQRLHRTEQRYRALLDQHGGGSWQTQTAALIGQTWEQLTTVDDHLLTRIDERRAVWQSLTKPDLLTNLPDVDTSSPPGGLARRPGCHKLTGVGEGVYCETTVKNTPATCHKLTESTQRALSQINPLYSGSQCDTTITSMSTEPGESIAPGGTPERDRRIEFTQGGVVCPVTGVIIEQPQPRQRFVSRLILRNDDALFMELNHRFSQYRKGSKEDDYSRTAHNIRNVDSNVRNNLAKRIRRSTGVRADMPLPLFPTAEVVRLTPEQWAILEYWKGTSREIQLV